MIIQNEEEVAEAMKENPEQCARLFLDGKEMIDRLVKMNDIKDHNIAKLEQMLRRERGEIITEMTIQ